MNSSLSLSLVQFGQILKIPYNGQVVFTNEWDLASLAYSQEIEGPYYIYLPTPDDIRQFLQIERVDLNRTIKSQSVVLTPNQILTKELRQDMRRWEELIRGNGFVDLGDWVLLDVREVLLDVRSAYATISSGESHRVAAGSIDGSSQRNQASAFVSNVPYSHRENQYMTYIDKELDNVLDSSHLRIKVGHPNGTEAYISKIGNLKLSNGLTLYDVMVIPEYCVTLISVHKLAKENKVFVAFDENRCYFLNQDLNLKNVLGIDDQYEGLYYYNNQGIKSNNSTLRYQCLLSQHDWHYRLGYPLEHVLNVLKDSLLIDKKDNIGCCEIYQRAKQTREPFSLSDHTSKCLGDLVHLDLWGPYKVTSYEGFRYFLTVVDDYTRAVWVYLIKSKMGFPLYNCFL
ncbi:ribonuclease H-like domain-containing protein [Tanacetum coccineum]